MIPNLTMIVEIVEFLVFIGLCRMFIWPPLVNAIEQRRKTIADALTSAAPVREAILQALDIDPGMVRLKPELAAVFVIPPEIANRRWMNSEGLIRIARLL